ncbi:MAG: hypothetical protein ACPGTS_00625 [Minisyncoccia bacterium]
MLSFLPLLFIITGFVVGLGSVMVMDVHGFLSRNSAYWTEAAIRTHKIAKPMSWIGTVLLLLGSVSMYTGFFLALQLVLILAMVLNNLFLSFAASPFFVHREKIGEAHKPLSSDWLWRMVFNFLLASVAWWGSVILCIMFIIQF